MFANLQFCLNSHSKILGISESYCFYRNFGQARQPLFIKKVVQDIHIPWLDLLNTENLYFDSVKPLKNMPHYVVSYGGSFTKSLCRPSAFNQREYVTAAICKPYIFHRAKLTNTEIIITIFPKPLI